MAARFNLANLRHRVHLCSQKDVVIDGDMRLNREGVLTMWAEIVAKSASAFTANGASVGDEKKLRTHVITTRYHRDFDVSNMAWIYEERRKSAPRWFKVIRVNQTEKSGSEFFMFDCRLIERAADLVEPASPAPNRPAGPAMSLPDGVKL